MEERLMRTIPIYFASTHGVYEFDEMECVEWSWPAGVAEPVETPKDDCVETLIVPENSFIIEAGQIGEYTLSEIDSPLWTVLQGRMRSYLVNFLLGKPTDRELDLPFTEYMIQLLRSLTIYYPGDTVVVRKLLLSAGIDLDHKEDRIERLRFRGMGFYKFNADPKEALPNPDTKISSSPNRYAQVPLAGLTHSGRILEDLRDKLITDDIYTTNESFIKNVRKRFPEAADGGIYVFSSCAEARYPPTKTRATTLKIQQIQEIQEAARLKMMSRIGELGRPEAAAAVAAEAVAEEDGDYFWQAQNSQESLGEARPWPQAERAPGQMVFVKEGNSYKQYMNAATNERIRELVDQGIELYVVGNGGLVPYRGGRRKTRKTRKSQRGLK